MEENKRNLEETGSELKDVQKQMEAVDEKVNLAREGVGGHRGLYVI
jgi:hypothetical protein